MPLLREQRGHVAVLTLSRPDARNAWCEEFQTGLRETLPALEADPAVRCVILTGDPAGGAFSAGADLKNPRTHTMASAGAFIEDLPSPDFSHSRGCWLGPCRAKGFSRLANTTCIGGGAKIPWHGNYLRHHPATV